MLSWILLLAGCDPLTLASEETESGKLATGQDSTNQASGAKRTGVSEFPTWLLEMYPDSILEYNRIINQNIWKFEPLNDSVNLVYLRRSDLTCSWTNLAVLLHRRPINSVELKEICDQDLGYFEYEYQSFKSLDSL